MATDAFVSIALLPTLAIIIMLILVRLFAKKTWLNQKVLDLKWGMLLSGLIGSLFGLYFYSAATSYIEAIYRVAKYESLQEQGALSLALGWSTYMFILLAPVLLVGFAFLVFPILAALSWLGLVSALGILLTMLVFVGANVVSTYANPDNIWCHSNIARCISRSALHAFLIAFPVSLGFVIGARLPLLFSRRTTS